MPMPSPLRGPCFMIRDGHGMLPPSSALKPRRRRSTGAVSPATWGTCLRPRNTASVSGESEGSRAHLHVARVEKIA